MTKLKEIEKKILKTENTLKDLKEQRSECLKKTFVVCKTTDCGRNRGCGKRIRIDRLTYIAKQYYINEPYSERWEECEGQFVCPHCGCLNRLIGDREHYENLKYYFKNIEKKYEE